MGKKEHRLAQCAEKVLEMLPGAGITDVAGVQELFKELVSTVLENGLGDIEIQLPRDRKSEFDPQLEKKPQTTLSGDIEEKTLSMVRIATYRRI